jgi:hypothetical protein
VILNACGSQVKWLKIVLIEKRCLSYVKNIENGESATELAKDHRVGLSDCVHELMPPG